MSRDSILHRLRTELSKGPAVQAPPVPEVWPRTKATAAQLADRFAEELKAVHGELVRVASIEQARQKLVELVKQSAWNRVGVMERPLCQEVASVLEPARMMRPCANHGPKEFAPLAASLVGAEFLLADTGSCVIACGTAQERMLCYLPPACVVVARAGQLAEHLPAVWPELAKRCADPQARGELVIVTGPSRTADIEKILILGVHGPKKLVVLLIG